MLRLFLKYRTFFIICIYFLLPLVGFWRNFDISRVNLSFFDADFTGFYFPDFAYGSQLVKDILLFRPISNLFWDPYNLFGIPLLGAVDRIGLFYPVKLIFYILSQFFSKDGLIFLATYYSLFHMSLAGIFTYLFARRCLRLEPFAAFVAGLVYSMSGSFMHLLVFSNILTGPAFLPLQLYFFYTAIEKRSVKYALLAALSLIPILMAGYFPMFIYNNIFIFIFLSFVFVKNLPSFVTVSKYYLLGNIAAILLSMIVLLPNIEVSNFAQRQAFNLVGSGGFPFTPDNLLNYLIPHFFGVDKSGTVFGYVGVVSLILLSIGLTRPSQGMAKLFTFSGLFFFILSLGNVTFLHSLAYKFIPFYSSFRRTSFLHYLVSFSLAMLVGYVILQLQQRKVEPSVIIRRSGFFLLGGAILWIALFIIRPFGSNPAMITTLNDMVQSTTLFLVFSASAFIFFRYAYAEKISFPYFEILFVTILLLDLFTLNMRASGTNSDYDPRLFNSKPKILTMFLPELNRDFSRVFLHEPTLRYNSGVEKVYQLGGYYGLTSKYYGMLFGAYQEPDGFILPSSPLLDILGVRYVFTSRVVPDLDSREVKVVASMPIPAEDYGRFMTQNGTRIPVGTLLYVYENLDKLPRAYIVGTVERTNDDEQAIKIMQNKDLLTSAVVVSGEELPLTNENQTDSSTSIEEYRNSYVKIKAKSNGRSFLVLSDAYYPGWQAYVNGEKTKTYRANVALRGVYLEDGENLIEFVYFPLTLYLGAIISSITFVAIVFVFYRYRQKKNLL